MIGMVATDQGMIDRARNLLYVDYITRHAWDFPALNPSGIKIDQVDGQKLLVDDYDQLSTWFSVTDPAKDVIACARLCREDGQGRLEVERYPSANLVLSPLLAKKKELNLLELNREAVYQPFVSIGRVSLLLLQTIFEYCLASQCSVFTTTHFPEWMSLYDKIAFPKLPNVQFKYFPSDLESVYVYFADQMRIPSILSQIKKNLNLSTDNF